MKVKQAYGNKWNYRNRGRRKRIMYACVRMIDESIPQMSEYAFNLFMSTLYGRIKELLYDGLIRQRYENN